MKSIFIIPVLWVVLSGQAAANNFAENLGLEFWILGRDSVRVCAYPYQRVWLNGTRVHGREFATSTFVIHVGDQIDEWDDSHCFRCRFDRLSGALATFSVDTYMSKSSYLGDNKTQLSSGRLISSRTYTQNLKGLEIVDYDPTLFVESSSTGINRSKTP